MAKKIEALQRTSFPSISDEAKFQEWRAAAAAEEKAASSPGVLLIVVVQAVSGLWWLVSSSTTVLTIFLLSVPIGLIALAASGWWSHRKKALGLARELGITKQDIGRARKG